CAGPGEITAEYRPAHRCAALGQCRIERDRFRARFISSSGTLGKGKDSETAEPVVVRRDTGIGQSIVGIERNRLVITNNRARESVFGKRVPIETAAQVSLVSLGVVRAALSEPHALVAG